MTDTTAPTAHSTRDYQGHPIPAAGEYQFDVSHSHVGFAVKHLMVAKTRGSFGTFSGSLTIGEDPSDSAIDVEIEAASINSRDEQRDGHLRSADFLDVEQFPTLRYRSTGVRQDGSDWAVDGELTVKGVTRPVPLSVTFDGAASDPWGNTRAVFSATAKINREDFGLTWNQALETGGVLVGKDVQITIEVETIKS